MGTCFSRSAGGYIGPFSKNTHSGSGPRPVAQIGEGSDAKYVPADRSVEETEKRKAVAMYNVRNRPRDRMDATAAAYMTGGGAPLGGGG